MTYFNEAPTASRIFCRNQAPPPSQPRLGPCFLNAGFRYTETCRGNHSSDRYDGRYIYFETIELPENLFWTLMFIGDVIVILSILLSSVLDRVFCVDIPLFHVRVIDLSNVFVARLCRSRISYSKSPQHNSGGYEQLCASQEQAAVHFADGGLALCRGSWETNYFPERFGSS